LLYLGVTLEYVEIPTDLLCHVHGKSSLGREGIVIHQTAGLVDPGYRGNLTLEITVSHATILRPEMPIGQLTFQRLTTPSDTPYRGRYQDDREPVPSRLSQPVRSEVKP
jgi:dCTP deaminase